jgi:hypothetical protein
MASVTLNDVVDQLKTNNKMVEKTNSHLETFIKSIDRSRLDQLEAMRESRRGGDTPTAAGGTTSQQGGSNIAMLMAGIAAAVAGFFSGIMDSVKALFSLTRLDKAFAGIKGLFTSTGAIGKLFTDFKARWLMYVDDAMRGIGKLFQPITDVFKPNGAVGKLFLNVRLRWAMFADDALRVVDNGIKPITNIFSAEGKIAQLFKAIARPFMFPFEGFIDNVAKPFRSLFTVGEGAISKIFTSVARPFQVVGTFMADLIKPFTTAFNAVKGSFAIFSEGGALMKILGGLGQTLGRLFFPLTLIMTAYDTVKGAITGFEEDGFLGGIQGAITGLLNSIVGIPLDLLKSAVSWIIGKMGFSNAERMLDSFSFEDIITKAIGGVFNLFKSVVNGLLEAIATAVSALPLVPDSVGNSIRSLKFDMRQETAAEASSPYQIEPKSGSNNVDRPPAVSSSSGVSDGVGPVLSTQPRVQNGIGPVSSSTRPVTGMQNGIGSVLTEQRRRTEAAAARQAPPTVISTGGNTTSNVSQNTTNMISGGMPATRDRNDSYQQY